MYNIGQTCIKISGSDAQRPCIIVDTVDERFVVVAGLGVKKRRCNVRHLLPLAQKLTISKGADQAAAIDVLVKAGLSDKPSKPHSPKTDAQRAAKPKEQTAAVPKEKPKEKKGLLSRMKGKAKRTAKKEEKAPEVKEEKAPEVKAAKEEKPAEKK